ncbi:MAG: sulfite exporter TauE/SafE family protein [Panacagrimonas sp.]|nr:sulfite exporter TauE/SafE family protein [Panacagrimonas sp.]MCC2656067.1 sulfite exporter TauE/SafE family protein [Panacagrimonas sp.]
MNALAITLTVFAFLTSALSGIAGLGGGTILIGVFFALGLTPVEAVPLFAAVQFVSNTSRTVAYIKHVEWHAAGWFALTLVPATFLLAPYAASVNENLVRLVLAGLILASLVPGRGDDAPLKPRPSFLLAGALNGSLGMFVGATGLFVGRLFFRPEWRKETTVATLAFTQVIGHGLRVIAYGFVGFSSFTQPALLIPLCIAVVAGTWTGKQLHVRMSDAHFDGLFKAILIVLSLKLVWDSVRGYGWI